jgi:hypothetical protein
MRQLARTGGELDHRLMPRAVPIHFSVVEGCGPSPSALRYG